MATPQPFAAAPLTAPVEALDVLVSLLSEAEAAEPADDFYSRLCEATCRLVALRRAVIFLYDDDRRQVRAVGAHGMALDVFERTYLTPASADIVRRSLEEDRLVEVSEVVEREIPERFRPLLRDGLLVCTPMAAGGRWYGVILADRAPAGGPLTDPQRHTLWMVGKMCALAASARIATRQRERARRLSERLDLARDVHDQVVQRLFGVSMALSAEHLDTGARERCLSEIGLAVADLRAAMRRPPDRPRTVPALAEELDRLRAQHADAGLVVTGEEVALPPALERLAVSVLGEAVRNARKHADPSVIEVALRRTDDVLVLEVLNDGVRPASARTARTGLRLSALEALEHGGLVEFGPAGADRWRVRLAVPLEPGT